MNVLIPDRRLKGLVYAGPPNPAGPDWDKAFATVHLLAAMPDLDTLRTWKSLALRTVSGTPERHRIAIDAHSHLLVRLDGTTTPPTVIVLNVGLNDRGGASEAA